MSTPEAPITRPSQRLPSPTGVEKLVRRIRPWPGSSMPSWFPHDHFEQLALTLATKAARSYHFCRGVWRNYPIGDDDIPIVPDRGWMAVTNDPGPKEVIRVSISTNKFGPSQRDIAPKVQRPNGVVESHYQQIGRPLEADKHGKTIPMGIPSDQQQAGDGDAVHWMAGNGRWRPQQDKALAMTNMQVESRTRSLG